MEARVLEDLATIKVPWVGLFSLVKHPACLYRFENFTYSMVGRTSFSRSAVVLFLSLVTPERQ